MAFDNTMDEAASAFAQLAPAPTNAQLEEENRRRDSEENSEDEELRPLDESVEGEQEPEEAEDETDADNEQDEEPEVPAIDPPASWDAEAKALFVGLPPELQQKLVTRESQRDSFVTAKAAEAQQHRDAERAALNHATQLHQQYAEQLETYAATLAPQEPDYRLMATHPEYFAEEMAKFKTQMAQREYLSQQSAHARQQAEYLNQQQLAQQQQADDAELTRSIPEWSDPSKRTEVLKVVVDAARELGYPDDLIHKASAVDILAVRRAAEWKADAEKWRSLQKAKMEPVRAAKALPKVSKPGAAQPKGSARAQGLQDSMTRLRATGDVKDAAAAFRNLR